MTSAVNVSFYLFIYATDFFTHGRNLWSGMAEWLGRRIQDRKVSGSSPGCGGHFVHPWERCFTPISSPHPCVKGVPGYRQWRTLRNVSACATIWLLHCMLPRKLRWWWNVQVCWGNKVCKAHRARQRRGYVLNKCTPYYYYYYYDCSAKFAVTLG